MEQTKLLLVNGVLLTLVKREGWWHVHCDHCDAPPGPARRGNIAAKEARQHAREAHPRPKRASLPKEEPHETAN